VIACFIIQPLIMAVQEGMMRPGKTARSAGLALAGLFWQGSAHADALRIAPVYFSTSLERQSYLRVANLSADAGTITVNILDDKGVKLGTWTKAIAANTAPQFGMAEIEQGAGAKPQGATATVEITSTFTGQVQNAIWNPKGGALTNLSVCGYGASSDSVNLTNVHTTLLDGTYPSSIVISNTGAAGAATIDIFDAANGAAIGTWTSAAIPASGTSVVRVAQIQQDLNWSPTAQQFHLILKLNPSFSGSISHTVNNLIAGVITDMTARCSLSAN
jgi:hypothetical protein